VTSSLQEQLQRTLGGAYLLERELGGGGMSRVFVALERVLDRRVVVKVLLPELAAGVNVERFRREIQLAAQLQHPHIVPLLSAGEAEGLPYFIMPFVTGESLRARVTREGEFPVAETTRILRDVVSALAYAHGRGIIHRDVKPDNVLLSGGVAVVTDFGVAKAVSASTGSGDHAGLTSLGVALGTPAYMAPEQATASPNTDHRADIYALGVMAYEMLTGSPPFSGRSPQQVLAAHVVEEPEPVERRRPATPPMLAMLVKDCLAKRPADRPQTAGEVMQILDAIATPSGGTAATTVVRPATPAPRSRRWPLLASAAMLAVLLGGGAMWLRRNRPASSSPQVAPAVDHTRAILSPVESANTRPPAPTPEPARPNPPAARQTAPMLDEPTSKSPRSAPPSRRRQPSERTTVEKGSEVTSSAVDSAPSEESVPTVALPPTPPPVASPPAESVPVQVTPESARPTPPKPPVSASSAPAPVDPAPEIRRVVSEYAAAIESKSVPNLLRVYPGMTAAQQRGWDQFFQLVREVKARLSVAQLTTNGASADAQVAGTYDYLNTSTGRAETQPVSFRASFKNESGRWRISQVR
jgi:serine/threonine protein kinase